MLVTEHMINLEIEAFGLYKHIHIIVNWQSNKLLNKQCTKVINYLVMLNIYATLFCSQLVFWIVCATIHIHTHIQSNGPYIIIIIILFCSAAVEKWCNNKEDEEAEQDTWKHVRLFKTSLVR